jgi:uncharacterized protein (TIGR04141 family)
VTRAIREIDVPLQPLTVYLIRDVVKDAHKALKSTSGLRRLDIGNVGKLYVKRPKPHSPSWSKFFSPRIDPAEFGKVSSSGAVLLVTVAGRFLAVVFGTGRSLLDLLMVEQRFGLLTTLNAVDPKKVRSIDTQSLSKQGMQSRTQASRDSRTRDFGLDIDQDLVRAVAGTPMDGKVGETIAGLDSLHVSARIALDDLPTRLGLYLKTSTEKKYQTEFGWIDRIHDVKDATIVSALEKRLLKELQSKTPTDCWIAPEGIIEPNTVVRFQYGHASKAPRVSQLTLENCFEHFEGAKNVTLEGLQQKRVVALRADDTVAHEWPLYRCLYAELQHSGKSYLLNAGKWYQLDEEFVDSVTSAISKIAICDLGLPEFDDEDGERGYNERVVSNSRGRFILADRDIVQHGGGASKIEFCDLYSTERDIVHAKVYHGSAVLSHLFAQATVSGQTFKSDAAFRAKVNAMLPTSHRIGNPGAAVVASDYRIVLAIIGGPGSCKQLPFFSRLTLRNCHRVLDAYGYRVAMSHIPYAPTYAKKSTYRAAVTRSKGSSVTARA